MMVEIALNSPGDAISKIRLYKINYIPKQMDSVSLHKIYLKIKSYTHTYYTIHMLFPISTNS